MDYAFSSDNIIHIKIHIKSSWKPQTKIIYFDIVHEDLNILKTKILILLKSRSKNPDNFEYYLKYQYSYMPIIYEQDFYMMISDILKNHNEKIELSIKKINKKSNIQILYDEYGILQLNESAQNNDHILSIDRPKDNIYQDKEEVVCSFCHISNKDKNTIKEVGPFYGPFVKNKNKYYVHELCAIWTPKIYLDGNNKIQNLFSEIARCTKLKCSFCGINGGGLGCKVEKCRNTYHFRCVLNEDLDCRIDYKKFVMYCPLHINQYEASDDIPVVCKICDKDDDDEKLILCEKCDEAWHIYCLSPKLSEVPDGDWICKNCMDQFLYLCVCKQVLT